MYKGDICSPQFVLTYDILLTFQTLLSELFLLNMYQKLSATFFAILTTLETDSSTKPDLRNNIILTTEY